MSTTDDDMNLPCSITCLIYRRLSRFSTTIGSSAGLSLVGPTKVEARKSFLFTEGFFKVENKEHLNDFVVSPYKGPPQGSLILILQWE